MNDKDDKLTLVERELSNIKDDNNKNIFFVRIRRNTKTLKKEEEKDGLVYYGGFKPFSINKDGFYEYHFKKYLVLNSFNIKKGSNFFKKLLSFRKKLYKNYKLTPISFEMGNVCEKSENVNKDEKEKFKKMFFEKIDYLKNKYDVTIKENPYEIIINNKLDIEDIEDIEYNIINELYTKSSVKYHYIDKNNKDKNTKKERFNEASIFKNIKYDLKDMEKKELKLKKLIKFVKEASACYQKIKPEKEKEYQYQFILNQFDTKEYNNLFNNGVKPFEMEYYIDEKKQDGRIDVILYSSQDNGKVTDIYLIELKVDTKAIGDGNGIHKHLLDIKNIDKLNSDFYSNLETRIKNRHKIIYNSELNFEKYTKHYYIIIGQYDDSIDKIKNKIKDLNNEDSQTYKNVKEKINKKYKDEIKKISEIYSEIYKDAENKDAKNSPQVDEVKLYIDIEKWNKDNFHPVYVDKTEWFEEQKNEQN